jgi:ABC-type branched-subunit amino acid transport system ATPase component
METGRIVLEGPSEKLLHDDYVKQAYLGGHGATEERPA